VSQDSQGGSAEPIVVLVVEDDPLLLDDVVATIEEAGFTVKTASTGTDALRILENLDALRAVLTDIDLGGDTTGWQVARKARELVADIPIIYMTGGHADEWTVHGVPNSVLVKKPFAPAQIVTAVSQLLNATPPQ
jgi:DNA-binding response OmpR family regulator